MVSTADWLPGRKGMVKGCGGGELPVPQSQRRQRREELGRELHPSRSFCQRLSSSDQTTPLNIQLWTLEWINPLMSTAHPGSSHPKPKLCTLEPSGEILALNLTTRIFCFMLYVVNGYGSGNYSVVCICVPPTLLHAPFSGLLFSSSQLAGNTP